MINAESVKTAVNAVASSMAQNKEYLIGLDQRNGDGDLGISMSDGFRAMAEYLNQTEETDLGKLFQKSSRSFNEAAPSSLGTILSIGMMGIAKALRGKTEVDVREFAEACSKGLSGIMDKAGSKPGEKTILDALCPAVEALKDSGDVSDKEAFDNAAAAAARGAESTKEMQAVHGRAAYYGEKSIGLIDGGAIVGKLIFEGIASSL